MRFFLRSLTALGVLSTCLCGIANAQAIGNYLPAGIEFRFLTSEQDLDRQFGAVFDGPNAISFEFSKKEIGPSVVRHITYESVHWPTVISSVDISPPRAGTRLIPLSFSEKSAFLLLDLKVYDFYDKKALVFQWEKAGQSYTSMLSSDRKEEIPLGRYTIPISRISLCGENLTAYYDYTDRWTAGVFRNDNFSARQEFQPGKFAILQEPEIVKTGERSAIVLLRAEGAGEIAFSQSHDCGRTFSTVKGTGIPSPASMIRALKHNDTILVLHNRIASNKQGPRNRLDLTVTDLNLRELCTFNLIAENKEYMFSNFDMIADGRHLQVAMQTYNFSTAKDSIGLLRADLSRFQCN